jgi:hypothetical protein
VLPESVRTRLRYGSIDSTQAAQQLRDLPKRYQLHVALSAIAKLWAELAADMHRSQDKRRLWPAL